VTSAAVSWQRLLTVEILQCPAFRSFLNRLLYRTSSQLKVRVRVTLRLVVDRQSVHLSVRPLEAHEKRFIWHPWGHSAHVTSPTRGWVCLSQSYLATSGLSQSVRLDVNPFEIHDKRFFLLCNILSDEKMGLSLMSMLGLSSRVRIAHIACYWKFFLLHYTQVLCQ
jgi:hypothetical protein